MTCETCPATLPARRHGAQRFCTDCGIARERARNAARGRRTQSAARRAELRREGNLPTTGSPTFRAAADRALNRGRCRRHCPACGRLYQMQGFESACPNCADHLEDIPPQARFA